MKFLILFCSIVLSAYSYSKEFIPRAEDLITPEKIKQTINYNGEDIYFTTADTIGEKKIIRSFHTPIDPSNESINNFDNDILDYQTLRPLFKKHPYGTIEYHYLKDNIVKLTFQSLVEGIQKTVIKETYTPYHNYVMSGPALPVLITALPLKVGLKVKFSTIDTVFPYSIDYQVSVVDYMIEVTGSEVITLDNINHDTFTVEIYPENSDVNGVFFKGWFTKSLPNVELQNIYTSSKNKDKDNSELIHKSRKVIRLN
jgi:hypothetical protein